MNAHITENNTPAIPAATIARTVVLALALVNQLLSAAGKPVLPIDSSSVEQWVTAGLTTAAAIWHGGRTTALLPRPSAPMSCWIRCKGRSELHRSAAAVPSPPPDSAYHGGDFATPPGSGRRNRRAI